MKEAAVIVIFLALLPLLVWAVRVAAGHWAWSPESRRKAVHIAMGLAVLGFPWWFDSIVPVIVLCVLSLGVLGWLRWRESRAEFEGLLVLHGVNRSSFGDVLFPLAVVGVFGFSQYFAGDHAVVLYVVPILVLAVADAAGALIGSCYGVKTFANLSGCKSVEGSFTFFMAAFLSAHIPILLMTDTGRVESLMIACILALVVMLVEAIATRGLDNLVVPLAAVFLLERFLGFDVAALSWRLLGAAGLFAVVFCLRRGSSLNGGALLGAVLFGYGCWALGGWMFVVPPLLLFFEHLWVTRRLRRVAALEHDLCPMVAIGLSTIPWPVVAAWHGEWAAAALGAFVCGTVAHLAMFNLATRVFVARRRATARMKHRAVVKALLVCGIIGWLLVTREPLVYALGWLFTGLISRFAVEVHGRFLRRQLDGDHHPLRWLRQGVLALLAGILMFGVMLWWLNFV